MTNSIKIATIEETKNRVNELLGDIDIGNIAIVNLKDTPSVNTIKMGSIDDVKKNIQTILGRNATSKDVSVVKEESGFSIASVTTSELATKLKALGFDTLDASKVAVVKAEDLNIAKDKISTDPVKSKKFKK